MHDAPHPRESRTAHDLLEPDEVAALLAPAPRARGTVARLRIELARQQAPLGAADAWRAGSVVAFDAAARGEVEIYVDERRAARGELFIERGTWRVRIVEVLTVAKG